MTEGVVDLLELVEIQHHQRRRAFGAAEGVERGIDPLFHAVAIGKACQAVVFGEAVRLFLGPEFFGGINGGATEAEEFAAFGIMRSTA